MIKSSKEADMCSGYVRFWRIGADPVGYEHMRTLLRADWRAWDDEREEMELLKRISERERDK